MSWNIGMVMMAIIGLFLGGYTSSIVNTRKRTIYIFFGPFITATILYFCVSIIEGITSQTGSWFMIAVIPWAAIGFIFALAGMGVATLYKATKKDRC